MSFVFSISAHAWVANNSFYNTVNDLLVMAGTVGGTGYSNGLSVNARFNGVIGLAFDSSGNMYIADASNHLIRKMNSLGVVTTIAGAGASSGSVDGQGTSARFNTPSGVAFDSSGNLYVADTNNSVIRMITPSGAVSTFAGTAGSTGTSDGTGAAARFNSPRGLVVDSSNNIYVADTVNNTIRMITQAGVVTTYAGTAGSAGTVNGTGTATKFNNPYGIAIDASDNLYVADKVGRTIRKITAGAVVTTLAGSGTNGSTNGTGTAASFGSPSGLTVDSTGTVYVADSTNQLIRKITAAGVVTSPAGSFAAAGSVNGTGAAARFNSPLGMGSDSAGNIYVGDSSNGIIRKLTGTVVTTVAGTAVGSGNSNGTRSNAKFNTPRGMASDAVGNLYVADTLNNIIKKVSPAGVVTTLAGSGGLGSTDGTGTSAKFSSPQGVALDSAGNLYVSDSGNNTIRMITPAGVVTTIAGTAGSSGTADGTGTAARFNNPYGIAIDASGNIFVADSSNHTIRMIAAGGVVTTLAGSAGTSGSNDGTGTATKFNNPIGLAIDNSGNIFVADGYNYTIRKVTSAGVVTTFAGSAGSSGTADGTGAAARFYLLFGLAIDPSGNLYISDNVNNTIRKITPLGVVSTVVGRPGSKGVSIGPLPASLNGPIPVAANSVYLYTVSENAILYCLKP